ncbi:MAG TPA: delta-60 repeat domain-containing protein [Acidimicrobiia bacterium]|jgi:uncharacterized delta-60 repeat protein
MVGILVALLAPSGWATPGELDVTFGTGGVQTTNFGGTYDWAYAAAVQPDDHILAAGVSNSQGTYDFALARYTPDRALDPTFGDGGTVTTDFGESYDWAYAVALQPDGKIVVAGVSDRGGSKNLALARYLPNGALDGGFGKGGLAVDERRPLTTDCIHGLALQPDGRIVVAGVTFEDKVSLEPQGDFILARYTPEGEPDPTFGLGGVVTTDFDDGSYDFAYDVLLQPDGRIVLGGYSTSAGGPGSGVLFGADQLALARYTSEGLPDLGFGQQGEVVVDAGSLDEEIRALALTPAGNIVAAGFANGERRGDMLVARFGSDGSLDPTFGNKGLTVTDFGTHSERLTALALQPDGWIVAAGEIARHPHADFAVVRYDPAGHLDPGFGAAGVASVDFDGRQDQAGGLVLQRGKPVVVGSSEHDFAVARFNRS